MFVYVEKTVCCILVCIFFFPDLYGQSNSSSLRFEAISQDLGIIKEADGSVFQTFTFVNSSSGPVKFGRVSPSCRCVNVIFTSESFESGEMGEVIISFNPAGEKGKVYRYADIYSSEGTFLAKLSITANVIPEEQTIDEQYKFRITDHVYANSDQVNMGYIPIGGSASKMISVINFSSESIKIQARPRQASSFLTTSHPVFITPGQEATIEIAFEIPEDPNSYGIKNEIVNILVNSVRTPFELSASCICTDRFIDDGSVIPNMVVSPSLVSLKRKLLTRSYEGHFTITNRGCADLHIRAVETQANINTTIHKGDVIRPGEKIKIRAESTKKTFNVFLTTNDPARPVKEIRFNYEEN
jgi:hypothetical protein